MKIRKLYFKKHKVFNDHEIVFFDEKNSIPKITYLVGNNGSGKTHILESIYFSLSQPFSNGAEEYDIDLELELDNKETIELAIVDGHELSYSITKGVSNNAHNIKTKNKVNTYDGSLIQKISKVVYSTVEINFTTPAIQNVTSKNLDEQENPKDKSTNLGTEIPQLLVDIQALDNAEKGGWVDKVEQESKDNPILVPHGSFTNRLKRFTSVFDKIFDGQKKFKGIETKNNQKHIVFTDTNGNDTGIPDLSSGEKQIIFRIGYILKNLVNIKGGIILIDEPEISLHPMWQTKFKETLLEVFDGLDVQIIIATHSPYIFKHLDETKERCIKVSGKEKNSKEVKLSYKNMFLSPSVNLISYKAFGVYDEMLHSELYCLLQSFTQRSKIDCRNSGTDCGKCLEHLFLQSPNVSRKTFIGSVPFNMDKVNGSPLSLTETLPTLIRNKTHHSDEINRVYSKVELKEAIDYLLSHFT